jgi:hypothetical protein
MEQFVLAEQRLEQLQSIDRVLRFNIGTFMHQRQRNFGEEFWPIFCSVRRTVIQRVELTVIHILEGTSASIPTDSLSQASFQTLKVLRPKKTLMLE